MTLPMSSYLRLLQWKDGKVIYTNIDVAVFVYTYVMVYIVCVCFCNLMNG